MRSSQARNPDHIEFVATLSEGEDNVQYNLTIHNSRNVDDIYERVETLLKQNNKLDSSY